MKTKQVIKKVATITLNVLLYAFILLCLFGVIVSIMAKKDADGTATVFGVQMRSVLSPSMEACELTDVSDFEIKDIKTKSVVFVKVVPENEEEKKDFYKSLKVGDVLTFKYTYVTQETITHRIIAIEENGVGGYIIQLAGDNKNSEDGVLIQTINTSDLVSTNYVIGKVTGQSYALGLFIWAVKAPVGLIFIVILPSLIIIVLEIIRIVNVLKQDKEKKLEEEREELKLLREKIKAIESGELNIVKASVSAIEPEVQSEPQTNEETKPSDKA